MRFVMIIGAGVFVALSVSADAAGSGTLPSTAATSICSTDNALTFAIQAVPALAAPARPATPTLTLDDVATIFKQRISACAATIEQAPAFARISVKLTQGFDRPPSCDALPQPVRPATLVYVLSLLDQLDNCAAYATLLGAVPAPTISFKANHPTIYVINSTGSTAGTPSAAASSGGGAAGGSGGGKTRGSGGGGGGGAGSGGGGAGPSAPAPASPSAGGSALASTGSGSIDNAAALLLYDLAIRFGYSGSDIDVVPAPAWSLTDFNNQCVADPPAGTSDSDISRGTLGAIVLDEATTTNGGSFALLFVNGWTRVKYSVNILDCHSDSFPSALAWHGFAEGQSFRNGVAFLPINTYLTYLSTKWTNGTSTTSAATTVGTVAALGYFSQPTSGLTIGDTGSTMTIPRAYDDAAQNLFAKLTDAKGYCTTAPGSSSLLCKHLISIKPRADTISR